MHSNIVNGHKLLCDAHTVLEKHVGIPALFVSLSIVIFRFSFSLFVTLKFLFIFLGASIVCLIPVNTCRRRRSPC